MIVEDLKYIVVHCSDSPQGRGDNAETIHRWHLEKGWDGIGYHYVIDENGNCENGRPLYWQGSHVRGYNGKSIGICLIGEGEYTDAQYSTLRTLIGYMETLAPNALVVGHNDLDKHKTCPKFDVKAWYKHKPDVQHVQV